MMELVCPAGNLPALKAAVDNGASAVYVGFRDETNARHFAGLNFTESKMTEGMAYARARGVKIFLALNTYPQPQGWARWQTAVDSAAALGVDAMIAADMGVLDYAAECHPELNLHLSVQGSATNYEALRFYQERFAIRRAVLPRVLSLPQPKASPTRLPVYTCVPVSAIVIFTSPWARMNRCRAASPLRNRTSPWANASRSAMAMTRLTTFWLRPQNRSVCRMYTAASSGQSAPAVFGWRGEGQ